MDDDPVRLRGWFARGKAMEFYGRLYRFSRGFVRLFWPVYRIDRPDLLTDPAIYVCRHFNSRGSFQTMPWLKGKIHPWAMYFYCDRELCYNHLMGFTLTRRFGWQQWKARLWAFLVAGFLPRLMQSVRAIPVYRSSMHVLQTYRMSVQALLAGESLLLFADRDYTSEAQAMGEMYDGFLALDRLYMRASGKHIPFITLYADSATKQLKVGDPLIFQSSSPDKTENERIYESIRAQLSGRNPAQPTADAVPADTKHADAANAAGKPDADA